MRSWMILAVVVVAATAAKAQAQTFVGAGGPVGLTPGLTPGTVAPGGLPVVIGTGNAPAYASWYVNPVFGLTYPLVEGTYYPPYDYFAAYPYPARLYSSGFSNDFPFYGQPYGNPSTPWTWATMSTYGNYSSPYASRFNPW